MAVSLFSSLLYLSLISTPEEDAILIQRAADQIVALASIGSASNQPEGIEKVGQILATLFEQLEMKALWSGTERSLIVKHEVDSPKIRVLLVGHFDTPSTKAKAPTFEITRSEPSDALKAWGPVLQGPGVADGKGGVVALLELLRHLKTSPLWPQIDVRAFISGDNAHSDLRSSRSEHSLETFATEKPVDLAFVFEPGIMRGDGEKMRLAIPTSLEGHYKLRIALQGQEKSLVDSKNQGEGAVDILQTVLQSFRKWRREGRAVVIYGTRAGSGRASVVPGEATASLSFRFIEDSAQIDETFQIKLQQLLEEISEDLKGSGYQLATLRDKLIWSPQGLMSKDDIREVEAAAADLGLPKPEFVSLSERGAETFLYNRRIRTVGSMGPVGLDTLTKRERSLVGTIPTRIRFCTKMIERLLARKVGP